MDPEALMRMMQMGDQQGAPRERGSGRPRGAAPNGGAAGATPDVGALLSSLGPDGMPDLDKIARASGMDPETMRGHAQRLWKHMDELAEKSPDEYRSFLEKQAANAKNAFVFTRVNSRRFKIWILFLTDKFPAFT